MTQYRSFRALPARTLNPRIDRVNGVVRDVVAMQTGDAIGHGRTADLTTLSLMAELGNAKNRVNGRFGHPAISANAMGKRVMSATNFRVMGNKLLQDVQLDPFAKNSPSFARDPIPYLLDRIERDPANIGMSVVITSDSVWVMEDGTELSIYSDEGRKRRNEAVNKQPLLRPEKFHFVDVVDEGALTPNGMFDIYSGDESQFALLAFEALDQWRERFGITLEEIPDKIQSLTRTYISLRLEEQLMSDNPQGGIFDSIFRRQPPKPNAGTQQQGDPNPQPNVDLSAIQADIAQLSKQVAEATNMLSNIVPAVNTLAQTTETMRQHFGQELANIDAKFAAMQAQIDENQRQAQSLSALQPIHPMNGWSPTHQGSVADQAAQFQNPHAPTINPQQTEKEQGLNAFTQLIQGAV